MLISGLPAHLASAAEIARRKFAAIEAVYEEIGWQGVWKWTFVYATGAEPRKGWAYLVPDPSKLRLSLPIPAELMQELPLKKLSKFVRDGLLHSPLVGRTKWPMWEIQGKGQVEDILELAKYKMPAQVAKTAAL
jgi:hypothetical protein